MGKDVKVGDAAPDFSLRDFSGREMRLSSFQGREFVVLIFLRSFS